MKVVTFSPIYNRALTTKTLPKRIKVLDIGRTDSVKGPVIINDKTLRVFNDTQKQIGRQRVPIDFNHNTVQGSSAYEAEKEPRAVAGYGTPVIDQDGLWLEDITWTPTGEKAAKDYEDLSPAPILDDEDVVTGLHSVALCPAGAINDLHFYNAIDIKDMKTLTSDIEKEEEKEHKDLDNDQEKGESKEHKEKVLGKEDEKHPTDCMCATCKSADEEDEEEIDEAVHKKHLEDFDSEDHYSKYGDVKYADKENHKYPIDTYEHVRAALAYINMPKNAKKYSGDKLSQIKSAIKAAAEKHGVDVAGDKEKTKTKTMSAVEPRAVKARAYMTEPENTNTFRNHMNKKIAEMASEFGFADAAELEKRLKAWIAEWLGEDEKLQGPITDKKNSTPEQFSAEVSTLNARIQVLENDRKENVARMEAMEKQNIISEATKNGKVVPFSVDEVKELSSKTLKSIVDKLPATVPLASKARLLSAEGKPDGRKSIFDSAKAIQEQVDAVLAS